MVITQKHKNIYNCFLKHYRNGEPYKPRQNFDDLDPQTLTSLLKLHNFLEKFDHIDWNEFFGAPRSLHPDEKCPHLEFFLSRAAIKAYSLFKQKQELRNPASQLEDIRKGMSFIGMFCLKNGIKLEEYLTHKEGLMYSWTKHYREHHISPYCLMELGDVLSLIFGLETDEEKIYIKDLGDNIGKMKTLYYNSPETKDFIKKATKKVKEFVDNHLQKQKVCVNI